MNKILISSVLGPAFHDIAHDVFRHGHTHYDLSGGRGSLKSSAVSLMVPLLLVANPGTHALVLRKVGNTLRDSVYAQYMWAIEKLGMAAYWDAKIAPLELIYRPTGQKIMFRGADDPMKIKSIKVPFGYIAVTHFEEKDQFSGREEIRTILQSTMRSKGNFWNFESYNPPISRDNWANIDSTKERSDRMTHKSTYLQAPPEWLGEQFLAEAEYLKATNERAYRHEYLGEAIGSGGNVFDNLELRKICNDEIGRMGAFYDGLDFGYWPDPTHWVRVSYDPASLTVYVLDELRRYRTGDRELAGVLKERFKKWDSEWKAGKEEYRPEIICDSASEKPIADLRAEGIRATGAMKGPGSVEAGLRWLRTRKRIVIDPSRTPDTAREFQRYEHEKNRAGEYVEGYPDRDNHAIDAVRYALNRVWLRRDR